MSTNIVQPMPRTRPPESGTEWESLTGMLDFFRATVVNKVAGLTDEQAFSAVVPPSTLTPGGLVKHLTGTERFWFSIDFAGADLPYPWPDDDMHGAFAIDDDDTLPGSSRRTSRSASGPAKRSTAPTSTTRHAGRTCTSRCAMDCCT